MASLFRREPSWIAVAGAQGTLAAWLSLITLRDLFPDASAPVLTRAASPFGTAVLGVFGFVLPVILGMFPRLAPGLLGLPRPSFRAAAAPAAAGALLSASSLAWTFSGEAALVPVIAALGAAGGALLVAAVRWGKRRQGEEIKVAASAPFIRLSRPGNMLLGAGLAYLLAGSLLLLLVSLDPAFTLALGATPWIAWPLHLLTTGFIALTVFGVGTRMFSAFAGADTPAAPVWLIALAGVPAPAGIAWGLALYDFRLIALFGTLALVAAATFMGVVFYLWAHHKRRRRKAWYLLMAASCMLVVGESFGVLFALDPRWIVLAPVHGEINTVGFAGLMIFGVLFELSGGQSAMPGRLSPGVLIAFVWPAALALRALGVGLAAPPLAAAGDLALVASLALAALDAHPSGPHPLPGKKGPL